jgi:hypothetical protein
MFSGATVMTDTIMGGGEPPPGPTFAASFLSPHALSSVSNKPEIRSLLDVFLVFMNFRHIKRGAGPAI